MNQNLTVFLEVLAEVLEPYGFSPTIARALRFFLRNPYESLVIVNKQGKLEFMDRGSEKFFGLSEGAAKGKDITQFVPDSDLPRVLKTGTPFIGKVVEVKGLRRLGSTYPLIYDGKVIGAMGRLFFRSLEEIERIKREQGKLRAKVRSLRQMQRDHLRAIYRFDNILGISPAIKDTISMAKKIAMVDTDVLIVGESGTGKELFAQAIHNLVDPKKPFVRVNSPAIPFEIAESELFGYEKGAFSGANSDGKMGKFEVAENGTIFLDEISSLPLSIQPKLLRVLQEREIERLGSSKVKKVNFRMIAASNVDLKSAVANGKFRKDLYYRIARVTIYIPPLRERKEDIPVYVQHFLQAINERFGTGFNKLSDEAMTCFMNYEWPGNVRELINVLEQAALKQWEGEELMKKCLPAEVKSCFLVESKTTHEIDFRKAVKETEKSLIIDALRHTRGNKRRAASLLGIPRSTLYKKLIEYDINALNLENSSENDS